MSAAVAFEVLAIVGSLRRGGSTAAAVDLLRGAVRRRAVAAGLDIRWETIALSAVRVEACTGCRACFDRGAERCPRHDDLLTLRDRMVASDLVVFATPVYVNDVSGSLKTLIDRLAFLCHRPSLAGIGFCLVATTGASPCATRSAPWRPRRSPGAAPWPRVSG
jgi:multimeric flavodoxin WrbA